MSPFNLLSALSAPALVCNQDAGGLPGSPPESQQAFFRSSCFKADPETHAQRREKDRQVAGTRQTCCAHVKV